MGKEIPKDTIKAWAVRLVRSSTGCNFQTTGIRWHYRPFAMVPVHDPLPLTFRCSPKHPNGSASM